MNRETWILVPISGKTEGLLQTPQSSGQILLTGSLSPTGKWA